MSEELKPCPFCREPLVIGGGFNPIGRCLTEGCWMSERQIGVSADAPREVEQWNTRTEPTDAVPTVGEVETFQARVGKWMHECFGPKISNDRLERRDRFVEEALELAQTLPAFTADRAHALVDYVFSRPVGLTEQEVGGASVTLAALCFAEGIDQTYWAETELTRILQPEIVEKIRAKQAGKPTGSALPTALRTTKGEAK